MHCDNGSKVGKGFPHSTQGGDGGGSPSLPGGWGERAGAGVGLAADLGQQQVLSSETNFQTHFFSPPFLSVDMTLVLVRNQISF